MPPPNKEPLIIGMSGGADSTALALVLSILGYSIHLAHLDHALRSESAAEAIHVATFADTYSLPCTQQRINVQNLAEQNNMGLEEAGRLARYSFFKEVQNNLNHNNPCWIATGHHANDLAEDILMRLIRGTGWPALGGMQAIIKEKKLMRPLLETSKDEIITLLTNLKMPWCHDPTNDSLKATRNRIRHKIIPLCLEENPHFLNITQNLRKHSQDDREYWNQQTEQHSLKVKKLNQGFLLPRNAYKNLHKAERLRLYKHLIEQTGGTPRAITLSALDKARNTNNKCFQYPKTTVQVTSEGLYFSKPEN